MYATTAYRSASFAFSYFALYFEGKDLVAIIYLSHELVNEFLASVS